LDSTSVRLLGDTVKTIVPTSECSKITYSKEEAKAAAHASYLQLKAYECPRCGEWHLAKEGR